MKTNPTNSTLRRVGDIIIRGFVLVTLPVWGPIQEFLTWRRSKRPGYKQPHAPD